MSRLNPAVRAWIAILLGILAYVTGLFGIVLSPVAIYMGTLARREARQSADRSAMRLSFWALVIGYGWIVVFLIPFAYLFIAAPKGGVAPQVYTLF